MTTIEIDPCRNSLIEHPPESNFVLSLMSASADLWVAGRFNSAREALVEADIHALREWFHCYAQDTTFQLWRHGITRSALDKELPKDRKTPGDASAKTKYAIFQRGAWHCRFCDIRVIDPRVPKRLAKKFEEFIWGKRNLDKHACLAVLATHDHVIPRQWGGSNEVDNLVTACWPCQFSRVNYRIEDCGIFDPRDRPPIDSGWDGLCRVLKVD